MEGTLVAEGHVGTSKGHFVFVFHCLSFTHLQFALHFLEDWFELIEIFTGDPLCNLLRSLDVLARTYVNELSNVGRGRRT